MPKSVSKGFVPAIEMRISKKTLTTPPNYLVFQIPFQIFKLVLSPKIEISREGNLKLPFMSGILAY